MARLPVIMWGAMVYRLIVLLTLLATAALMSDAAQVLCFGEDGHAALERLVSDEHFGTAIASHDETLVPNQHASSDGVHVDVSVGDAGVKGRIFTPILSATNGGHATLDMGHSLVVVPAVPGVEAPTLSALRTTVLRT